MQQRPHYEQQRPHYEQAPIPARERVVQCLKRYEGLRYHQEARTPRAIQQLKNDWREAAGRRLNR